MVNAKTLIASIALLGSINAAPILNKRGFSGRGTFYSVGMGNCGWSSSSNQYVVALNTAQYGSTSQVSQYCGQTVSINYNGKSAQAQIVDSCPTCSYGDLDMSTSLFSYLTNGNMGLGEIQMSWSMGSGGGGSGSGSGSSSNSNSNSNNDNSDNDSSSSSSSSQKPTSSATPTSTSTSSTSSTSTSSATPTSTASANVPSGNANSTVEGVPSWWAQVGTDGCQISVPEGVNTAGIASYTNGPSNLAEQCGKWIEITNPSNNKTTKALVSTWLPGSQENSLVLGDAYKQIADMNGEVPNPVSQVKWGFIN